MRTFIVMLSLLLATRAASAGATDPVWKVTGLETPESALYDPQAKFIYISNIAGEPLGKDGKGFISKVGLDGKLLAREWVSGLNAPKGMALVGRRLFVADIGELVEIDVQKAKVLARHAMPEATFVNDVTADDKGTLYVSDMLGNAIWRKYKGGKLQRWVQSDMLELPNGLLAEQGRVLVASWGVITNPETFATEKPGRVFYVDKNDGTVRPLLDQLPIGNLDGLVADGRGAYYLTDNLKGSILRLDDQGVSEWLKLTQGTADLGIVPEKKLLLVPLMGSGELHAYTIE